MQVEKLVTRSSADLETTTMDSEMNMHADSETKTADSETKIRKLTDTDSETRIRDIKTEDPETKEDGASETKIRKLKARIRKLRFGN